jgi:GINS complex subunit 2
MDPDELEFISEKISISVIPNFNFDPIHLISGTIGKKYDTIFKE